MKKTIKLALVAAMAMGATSAFATNGDNLISTGAKSRAMGGVGIAKAFGAESALANPALLNSVKNSEVAGSLTFFMPSVSFASSAASAAAGPDTLPAAVDSDASFSMIPEFAFANRINDNLVYGVSLTGTAGMGVDYSGVPFGVAGDNGAFQMKTALELLKVSIPVSYEMNGATVGIAPILQYGTLQMSHRTGTGALLSSPKSSDTAYGYEIGAAYDFKSAGVEGLTVGAVYKSKLAMEYKNTISGSINAFGGAAATGVASGDNLDQPAEYGLGLAYAMNESTISFDYRNVAWGSAAGYKDFGWEDQNVYSVGYEYATDTWALRAGYNYAKSPIKEQAQPAVVSPATGATAYAASVKNFFNLAGFPGIVESHFTLGGSYAINKELTFDGSLVYASEVSESFNTTGMTAGFMGAGYDGSTSTADVTHSQLGVTLGLTYKF